MTSTELSTILSCARQLLGSPASFKAPAEEVAKAWVAVAAGDKHLEILKQAEQMPVPAAS